MGAAGAKPMRVKATLLRTRWAFLDECHGPAAAAAVRAALDAAEQRSADRALPGSWISFDLLCRVDDLIVAGVGRGRLEICREMGAYSARRNLPTLYRIYVEQAQGDPQKMLANLAVLHSNFYDWGALRAEPAGDGCCRLEADYAGGATLGNCLTACGFYAEALRQVGVADPRVSETACQVKGAPLCVYDVRWNT